VLLIVEGASCAITSDGNVFANNFALFPFVVIREHFRDADVGGTFVF